MRGEITDTRQATKNIHKAQEKMGLISETSLNWRCAKTGRKWKKANPLEMNDLKYPLLQKIIRNIILWQYSITSVARRKGSKFPSHFVWLTKGDPKCQFHREFSGSLKSIHCVFSTHMKTCVCVQFMHTHVQSTITCSFLCSQENYALSLLQAIPFKISLILSTEYSEWNSRCLSIPWDLPKAADFTLQFQRQAKPVTKSYWTLIIQENEQIHGGGGGVP